MPIATLVKITATRKLMMKISEKTYDMISTRLTAECKKKHFPTDRLATFSLENDDGDESHFVMISLDKYDKQNMRKFEVLLKKDVAIQYRMKPYDFIPDGEDEQRCGINLELISIRQIKPRNSVETMLIQHEKLLAAVKDAEETGKTLMFSPSTGRPFLKRIDFDEIDKIADQAAARAINPPQLNAEEQAIDEDVEKQVAAVLARLPLPPVLERQTAMSNAATRRRRTPVTATSEELTEVEKQVKYLDDLIAANERAIGADE